MDRLSVLLILTYHMRLSRILLRLMESDESKRSRSQTALAVSSVAQTSIYRPFGTGAVDERVCRHDPAHYGRAKTSALLVGAPFCYASACAGFEPFVTR